MAFEIFKVFSSMTLNTTNFTTQLNNVRKQASVGARTIEKDFSKLSRTFTSLGGSMAVLGGGLGYGLVKAFQSFRESGKELAELSRQTGIGTASLSRYKYAMTVAGLGMESFTKAIGKQQKAFANGKADSALTELGLDPAAIKAMASDKAFDQIIDKLATIKDVNQRGLIAQDLWGKSGTTFLRFLQDGKSKLKEYTDEAAKIGIGTSEESAKKMEQMSERISEQSARVGLLSKSIVMLLLPTIDGWITKSANLTKGFIDFKAKHGDLVTGVAKGVVYFALTNAVLGTAFLMFGRVFSIISTGGKVLKMLTTLTWAQFRAQMATNMATLGYIVLLSALALGMTADFQMMNDILKGGNGENVISEWFRQFDSLQKIVDKIMDKLYALRGIIYNISGPFGQLFKTLNSNRDPNNFDNGTPTLGDRSKQYEKSGMVKVKESNLNQFSNKVAKTTPQSKQDQMPTSQDSMKMALDVMKMIQDDKKNGGEDSEKSIALLTKMNDYLGQIANKTGQVGNNKMPVPAY